MPSNCKIDCSTRQVPYIFFIISDPIPVLEQALVQQQRLQQSMDHEIEVKQLRETLQEYNVEFAHVKNQEGTIQKLREQLKDMEDKMEERAAVRSRGCSWRCFLWV